MLRGLELQSFICGKNFEGQLLGRLTDFSAWLFSNALCGFYQREIFYKNLLYILSFLVFRTKNLIYFIPILKSSHFCKYIFLSIINCYYLTSSIIYNNEHRNKIPQHVPKVNFFSLWLNSVFGADSIVHMLRQIVEIIVVNCTLPW